MFQLKKPSLPAKQLVKCKCDFCYLHLTCNLDPDEHFVTIILNIPWVIQKLRSKNEKRGLLCGILIPSLWQHIFRVQYILGIFVLAEIYPASPFQYPEVACQFSGWLEQFLTCCHRTLCWKYAILYTGWRTSPPWPARRCQILANAYESCWADYPGEIMLLIHQSHV